MKEEVPLPRPPSNHPPALVLGGDEDVIVDIQALEESGELYGVKPVILKSAAHDVMLVSCSPYPCFHHAEGCEPITKSSGACLSLVACDGITGVFDAIRQETYSIRPDWCAHLDIC